MNKRTFLTILGYLSIVASIVLFLSALEFFYLFFFFGVISIALADILKGQKEILVYIHSQNNSSVELNPEEKIRLKNKVVINNDSLSMKP